MTYLLERFTGSTPDGRLRWFHAPRRWRIEDSRLIVEADAQTDFWQKTHYGFEADSGHFLFVPVSGDFVMTSHVRFHPVHQYDQAGLMVRWSEHCWLKTSVECEGEEPPKLGAVVTNAGYSDWSVQEFDRTRQDVWLRVNRAGDDFIVEESADGNYWKMLRMAHLDGVGVELQCGLYACSPKGEGFRAEFSFLQIDRL